MSSLGNSLLVVFGGITTLALVSVVISKKSGAADVIQAASSALSTVVAAATNPVSTASTNGNLGLNTFTLPAGQGGFQSGSQFIPELGSLLGGSGQ